MRSETILSRLGSITRIVVDEDACILGWGPCLDGLGFSHCCKKRNGHDGMHICGLCGARTKESDRGGE